MIMLSGEYDKLRHAGYRLMEEVAREQLPRRFRLTFDNSKKHGRFPMQTHSAFGCEFPEGLIAIGTNAFGRKGFESMQEMREAMGYFGDVKIEYID